MDGFAASTLDRAPFCSSTTFPPVLDLSNMCGNLFLSERTEGGNVSKVDALQAEVRAIEAGVQARKLGERTYAVKCQASCNEGVTSHVVSVEDRGHDRPLHLTCDCPGGRYRLGEPIPCLHAATVGRRLEREGQAVWKSSAFWIKPEEKMADVIVLDLWERRSFAPDAR